MIAISLGTVLGIISGLIPGVGNFILILLVWPFLYYFSILELLMMYVSMASISQYIGSIPAIVYGIPGESSSYPAVVESRNLTSVKQVSEAISGSAFGSMIGGLLVVLLCLFFADQVENIKYLFSTKMLVILLCAVLCLLIFTTNNAISINILLIAFGLFLGFVGYNSYLDLQFFTFDIINLWAGLPLPVVLICLFAVPQIFHHINISDKKQKPKTYRLFSLYIMNPLYLFFNTLLGFLGGLVPGLTTVFSSSFAYGVSTLFTKDPVKRIVSSETANNAGAFSMLLPLLIFGIPLIGSEAVLLFLMEQKGFNIVSFSFSDMMPKLAFTLLLVNIIGFLLAWPLSKHVYLFYSIDTKKLMVFLLVCLFAIVLYLGYLNYSISYYLLCFCILSPIGFFLRDTNTLPLVFAFLIHDKLLNGLFRFYQLIM